MSTPAYEQILYEVEDPIATITLNRPERLNAWTDRMAAEVKHAVARAEADPAVVAIVLTGAGRGFCAGADLKNLQAIGAGERGGHRYEELAADPGDEGMGLSFRGPYTYLLSVPKPVIAAINGPAVGVGITMTLPMDIRLASTEARIGFVFAKRGIVPEAASSWFLPRLVGISRALEWAYSGRVFPAAEALEAGLVRSLHEPDDLLPAARELAATFADGTSAVSVATTRQMLWRMLGADHPMEAHKVDSRMIDELGRGVDVAEGVMSFLEKRPPAFPGRPSTDMPPSIPWWEERPFE